jgi:CMP-N,N'-diacetyllegionaminic acid synthase
MKTLWLVTARAGSKSIPHKNVRPLAGHPLLAWRIAAARALGSGAVWLSTDSADYAAIGERYGARVPFLRPPELATDSARSIDVALHAMAFAEAEGAPAEALGLLEPTSPFVRPETLRAARARLEGAPAAHGVVATRVVRPSSFHVQPEAETLGVLAARMAAAGTLRRQDEAVEITPSGGFYIARWRTLRADGGFYVDSTLSHRVSELEALEIDEPIDWDFAEFLVESGRVAPPPMSSR